MSNGKSIDFLLNPQYTGVGVLSGGTVEFYNAGTTTKRNVYLERDKSVVAANPYTLTANGNAELFADGVYRIILRDSNGVLVYDYDNVYLVEVAGTIVPVLVDATGGDATYTWEATVTDLIVAKTDATANTVTLIPPAGYTIQGSIDYVLWLQYEGVVLLKDEETVSYLIVQEYTIL